MATLLKFKLLATQCSTPARSPPRSPAKASRRRPTLRKLLSQSPNRRFAGDVTGADRTGLAEKKKKKKKKGLMRRTLRDLLVSSPPPLDGGAETGRGLRSEIGSVRRGGFGGRRFGPVALRNRLLRRTWRPVLVTIPE